MNVNEIATTLVAASVGALLGGGIVWRVIGARAAARHANLVNVAREQLAANTQSLRATNTRLQGDLERERASTQHRHKAFVAEQRSSVTRLEGQLRFAYAEIDRLNAAARDAGGPPTDGLTDSTGFALTRPYER